ncbi:DUF2240 family protein [Candidatus Woesearchaeota archaeon]|nr:DUF2240 family protein [Candidatus Woesearchaeota archaeon]
MIKVPFDMLVEKIKEQAKISDGEIDAKIKSKMDQLSGLISKEGAAHIIANELGVKLFDESQTKVKIKRILEGMRSVETVGKITQLFDVKEFNRKDGSAGKVLAFTIGDETGTIRVVLWNEQTDIVKDLKMGIIVKVVGAYSRNNNNNLEIHLATKGEIIPNPEGETVGEVAQPVVGRRKIADLKENESNIELLGTIVQAFEPRFYEVCPECGKRAKQKENGFECPTHGSVATAYGYVMNTVLDDGTSTIRTIFFRNQMNNLLQKNNDEILKLKENTAEFQAIKDGLLGKIVKIVGRVTKNEMFDRIEFISQQVFPDPNPDEELKRLEKEAEAVQ